LQPDFIFDHVLQARAVSTDGLRPSFYTNNVVVYVIQVKNLAHDCTCGQNSRFKCVLLPMTYVINAYLIDVGLE